MVYYDINGIKFDNPFAAFLHGSIHTPHTFPKFDFYDREFSTVDWTIEPAESFQTLCDRRAHQLRNKYDKIILAFSGGTDSITIYNTFLRNNIHIDEIYVIYSQSGINDMLPETAVTWLLKNHPDKNTKINIKSLHTHSDIIGYEKQLLAEDYLINDDRNLRHHTVKYCRPLMHQDNFEQSYKGYSYCTIAGFEKPYLIQRKDGYYFGFLDHIFAGTLNRSDLEFFFISPDLPALHAKQCHTMLNYCLKTNTTIAELEKPENYYLKATVQGRDTEIETLIGHSLIEKKVMAEHSKIIGSIDFSKKISSSILAQLSKNSTGLALFSGLQRQSSAMKKYINGWHILQTDQTLISYMVRMGLLSSAKQPVQSYYAVCSQQYKIK
jgi:hypothetical protein